MSKENVPFQISAEANLYMLALTELATRLKGQRYAICHTRASLAGLQCRWLFSSLCVVVECRVRAVFEMIQEAGYQGDQGELNHA